MKFSCVRFSRVCWDYSTGVLGNILISFWSLFNVLTYALAFAVLYSCMDDIILYGKYSILSKFSNEKQFSSKQSSVLSIDELHYQYISYIRWLGYVRRRAWVKIPRDITYWTSVEIIGKPSLFVFCEPLIAGVITNTVSSSEHGLSSTMCYKFSRLTLDVGIMTLGHQFIR